MELPLRPAPVAFPSHWEGTCQQPAMIAKPVSFIPTKTNGLHMLFVLVSEHSSVETIFKQPYIQLYI